MIDTGRYLIHSPWEVYRKETVMRGRTSKVKAPKGKVRGSGKPPKLERGFVPASKTKRAERLQKAKL